MGRKLLLIIACLLLFTSWSSASDWVEEIKVHLYPITFYFDGQKETELEKPGYYYNGKQYVPLAMLYEGTTYVPLRYASEKLGKNIGYDGDTYSIWVGEKPAELNQTSNVPPQEITTNGDDLYGITIGQSQTKVVEQLGQPQRKDESVFGYEWWIYNQDLKHYVQVGIKDGKVVDLYSNAPTWTFNSLQVGTSQAELQTRYELNKSVSFTYNNATFEVENELAEKPLALVNDTPVIFYLDVHNQNRLTGIRFMSKEILVQSGIYSLQYSMKLGNNESMPSFDAPSLSATEQQVVDMGNEQQSLDLANVIRLRKGLSVLSWNEEAAKVARGHSLDMQENQFFDHQSPTTGLDPFGRLESYGVTYRTAGENIAMGYTDAIESHEAWMNSIGHRKNILNEAFTTLGVGAHGTYHTQNFVTPW